MSRPVRQHEGALSDAIREALGYEPRLVVWRNSIGLFHAHGGGRVWAGLPRGSADLVGVVDGRFVALEVKRPGEIPTRALVEKLLEKVPLRARTLAALGARAEWDRAVRELAEAERHVLEQEAWLEDVRRAGGFAAYVDSVEAARAAVTRARGGATS